MVDIQDELASLERLDDRIVSTSNERLSDTLRVLLPKLVLLVNKEELRARVMKMFGSMLKRIKNLPECEVPMDALFALIRREHMPFACNFAMTFVDVAFERQANKVEANVVSTILQSILDWPVYSPQSNALLTYTLGVVPQLGEGMRSYKAACAISGEDRSAELRAILGDFYLDVALVRSNLTKGAAGSVLPGLNPEKVERLTAKKDVVKTTDLKCAKLALIAQLADDDLLDPRDGVLISVILAYDPDSSIAQQAAHKMAAYGANDSVKSRAVFVPLVSRLVRLCSSQPTVDVDTVDMQGQVLTRRTVRSVLKGEVRSSALRWMVKEMKAQLQHCPMEVATIFIDTFFGKASTEQPVASIRAAVMGMALGLVTSLNDESLASHANLYFRGTKVALESFSRLRVGGVGVDNDENMVLRERCYSLIENIARRCPLIGIADPQIIAVLFKLLDHEDERLSPRLYAALGGLRDVYKERVSLLAAEKVEARVGAGTDCPEGEGEGAAMDLEEDSAAPSILALGLMAPVPVASALGADDGAALQDMLQSASRSPESKKRLAALQWARALFAWQPITLGALELLADDSSETVNHAARREFLALNTYLSSEIGGGTYEQSGNSEQVNVLLGVLEMIYSPSDAFLDPKRPHARRDLLKCAASGLTSITISRADGGSESSRKDSFISERLWTNLRDEPPSTHSLPVIHSTFPNVFACLGRLPLPLSADLAESTVEAAASLIKGMLAYEPSLDMSPLVLGIEDRVCAWMGLVDADVGLQLARILCTTCLDHDGPASQFKSLLQKLLRVESASTQDANSKKAKRNEERVKEIRARGNVLQSIGALVETAAHRLRTKPQAAIAEEIKAHATCFFSRVHAALDVVVKGGMYDGMDIALAATATQAWTRIVEHGVFTNQYTAIALTLNQGQGESVNEKLVRLVSLFKDTELCHGALSSAAASSPSNADLGPGRVSFARSSASASSSANEPTLARERDNKERDRKKDMMSTLAPDAIHALTTYCVGAEPSIDLVALLWKLLVSPELWTADFPLVRFALGEGLARLAYLLQPACTRHLESQHLYRAGGLAGQGPADESGMDVEESAEGRKQIAAQTALLEKDLPPLMAYLIQRAVLCAYDDTMKASRGTAAVLTLVLVKHGALLLKLSQPNNKGDSSPQLSYDVLLLLMDTMLRLLRHGDPFTQDVACLGLCQLYYLSVHCYDDTKLVHGKSVAERISQEVIMALSREQRASQPIGIGVGQSSTSSESNPSPSSNTNQSPDNPDEEERRRRERDQLANAAAAAAGQLGLNIDEMQANIQSAVDASAAGTAPPLPAWRRRDPDPGTFGVYSTAIKVAKKSGDSSIVFAVLSLIRRDPSFGATETPTASLYKRYRPPIAKVDPRKMDSLLPMLFAAKFDPYDSVREVMRELWDTLVPAEYQHLTVLLQGKILAFLSQQLYSPVWRDREAACLALENFLVRRSWKQVKPRLASMWTAGLRVLDDVRDSTRMASLGFIKCLSDQVLRAANPSESSLEVTKECLDLMLPLLIDKGLAAPTPEGRGLTLGTLVSIVKVSKQHLDSWLPRLIGVLVECMSAMEPQTLQYMSFHTARLKMTEEQLDQMRLDMVKNSPMQEALDGCLAVLGHSHVPEVVLVLCSSLSHGIGLPTRAAAAQSLSYLVEKYPGELGVHINRAFRELINLLVNAPYMQTSLQKTLFSCLGGVGKVVDNCVLEESTYQLIQAYNTLDRNDRAEKASVIANCLQAVINRCGHKLLDNDIWTSLLAVVYIGTFDKDESSQKPWQAVWTETLSQSGAGNKQAALERAMPLLLRTIEAYLQDLSWERREHGLAVLQDVLKSSPDPNASLSPSIGSLVGTLFFLVKRRIWKGQEQVLEILALLVSKCEQSLDMEAPRASLGLAGGKTVLSLGDILQGGAQVPADAIPSGDDSVAEDTVTASPIGGEIARSLGNMQEGWAVSARGLLALLVYEAGRGTRPYRIAAAVALSSLPWKHMSYLAPTLFTEHLSVVCAAIGVEPYADSAESDGQGAGSGGGSSEQQPTEQQKIRALTRPTYKKKATSSLSLFGGRYTAPTTQSHGDGGGGADLEEGEVVILHDPLTAGKIVGINSSTAHSPSSPRDDMDIAVTSSRAEPPFPAEVSQLKQEEEEEALLEGLRAESLVLKEQAQAISTAREAELGARLAMDVDEGHHSAAAHDEQVALAGDPLTLRVPANVEPAARVKLVEMISVGWPVDKSILRDSAIYPDMQGVLRQATTHLLTWAKRAARAESWALRRGAMRVTESILYARSSFSAVMLSGETLQRDIDNSAGLIDEPVISLALEVIHLGSLDAKNTHVRVASLQALEALLRRLESVQGTDAEKARLMLPEDRRSQVRGLIRGAAQDGAGKADLLAKATDLQKLWLAVLTKL